GVRAGASAARVGGHACGYSVGQALSAELAGGGISGSGESFMRADRAGDCSPHSCGGAYGAQERRKAESVEATAAHGAVAQQAAGFGADDPTDIESLPGRRQLPAQAAGAGAAGGHGTAELSGLGDLRAVRSIRAGSISQLVYETGVMCFTFGKKALH